MTEIKRNRNNGKLIKAVNSLHLEFPIAEISERLKVDKGNLSSYLNNKKSVSSKFLEKFSKAYNIDLSEFEDDNDVLKKNPERSKIEDQQELDSLKKLIAFKDSQIAFYEKQIAFYEANCTCVKKQQTA
ncbi:helix-turn-helix domain-containing protein [Flavobacterium psychrophilum]|uniref:helix-turn-helix domain-containing protein n=1 Tax=Flavobacterium psychrophilum TaxID=96345 RepID=UPI000B7C54ED|nr:helix-turn-helix domain-containing protein [Flavobacterium psychrophilum]EKT4508349.1 helix-turn-helix transcriptional regulator [Flavobacterium psychrophilum]SNA84118.1 hypothetical protein FI070_440021 [Flavobacterium psychrophilum]